ncbi:hypothetical protein Cgig2_032862 [Carnegiea gigantea]|uniref:SWIM-type domain-containing protein n=1 Tax=Carnegiea gigantea TaxID=171969 RepID=A0A9Q1GWX7_9CARY|nr:hypothetical protein Cgig2_032862 [Carnegiea gigantea]
MNPYEFVVQHHGTGATSKHRVCQDSEKVGCSYKHFEFWKILCRHILSVFVHMDCFCVPSICFPMRWQVLSSPVEDLTVEDLAAHAHTSNNVGFVHCPPQSKLKELAKQVKTCSCCKRTGHNITTCPHKENFGGNANIPSNKKQKKNASRNEELNPIFSTKC